jgi:hypothetical protein
MYNKLRSDKSMLRMYFMYTVYSIHTVYSAKIFADLQKKWRPPLRMDLHGHFSARGFANVILNKAVQFKGIMSPVVYFF